MKKFHVAVEPGETSTVASQMHDADRIEGPQYIRAVIACPSTADASNAVGFLFNGFGYRLVGLGRQKAYDDRGFATVEETMRELGWRKDESAAPRCVDCGERLTPELEPVGVIFIRLRRNGKWKSVPICSTDYELRRSLVENPTRVLHETL